MRPSTELTTTQLLAIENIIDGKPTIYGCSFTVPIGWNFLNDPNHKSLLEYQQNTVIVESRFMGESYQKTLIDGRPVPIFNLTQTYNKGL